MIKLAEHAVAAAKTGPFRADRTLRLFSSRHHSSRYPDMTVFDFRPTLNAPDDDPYLWLEDVEAERTLAWAPSQSARTLGHFGGTQFDHDHDALTTIFDRPDKVPVITRRGQYLYNFWQDAGIRAHCGAGIILPPIRRSCSPLRSGTTASTRATRVRWPQSCRLLAIPPTSMSPARADIAAARTIASGRIHCHRQQFPSQCDRVARRWPSIIGRPRTRTTSMM